MASIFTQGNQYDRMKVLNIALKTFSIGQFSYPKGQCVGKAYEAFCLHLILRCAQEKGYTVSVMHMPSHAAAIIKKPTTVKSLSLRGAASNFKTGPFDFFEISHNNNDYEIHNNCYAIGLSGAKHDADILIIDKSTGNSARATSSADTLSHSDLLQAFECKNLDENISLDIARSMKGLIDDGIASGNVHILSNYGLSDDARSYFKMHMPNFANNQNTQTNLRFHGYINNPCKKNLKPNPNSKKLKYIKISQNYLKTLFPRSLTNVLNIA